MEKSFVSWPPDLTGDRQAPLISSAVHFRTIGLIIWYDLIDGSGPNVGLYSLAIYLESRKLVHYNYNIFLTNSKPTPLSLATSIFSNTSSICYVCHSESALHCSAEGAVNACRCGWYDLVRFVHGLCHSMSVNGGSNFDGN